MVVKSLKYLMDLTEHGTLHPQKEMKRLNIKYKQAIPQSMGNQWWFIDCELDENYKLPKYLKEMKFTDKDRKHWKEE